MLVNHNQQGKTEIAEILSRRSNQYTHAVVRAALALERNDQWKSCIASVELSGGEPVKSRSLTYSGFEIHVAVEKPEKILVLVEDLVTEGKFRIAKRVILLEHGNFDSLGYGQQMGHRVSSSEAWIPSEWPGDQYLFAARSKINPPSKPLISPGLPIYPDGYAAIEHLLGMDARGGRTWDEGMVMGNRVRASITEIFQNRSATP